MGEIDVSLNQVQHLKVAVMEEIKQGAVSTKSSVITPLGVFQINTPPSHSPVNQLLGPISFQNIS